MNCSPRKTLKIEQIATRDRLQSVRLPVDEIVVLPPAFNDSAAQRVGLLRGNILISQEPSKIDGRSDMELAKLRHPQPGS